MKTISAATNPFFKKLNQLAHSGLERRKAHQTLLDGVHLIQSFKGALQTLIYTESALTNPEIEALVKANGSVEQICLDEKLYKALSELKTPTGIMGLINIPSHQYKALSKFNAVGLEGIQDPGNLGSILRSSAAAGIKRIYLSKQCADPWSPKVLRAGMGAHFLIDIHDRLNLLDVAAQFEGNVIATSLNAKQSIYEADLTHPSLFIFGSEGGGLSPALAKIASQLVKIPMAPEVESLNVGAAAAICIFEQARQNQTHCNK